MVKAYPVGLVGEQHYQAAIANVRAGQSVTIVPEPTNPYDPRALAVHSKAGQLIGYIPKDSFIQRVIHDDGDHVLAVAWEVYDRAGFTQVVIAAVIHADGETPDLGNIEWPPRREEPAAPASIGAGRAVTAEAKRSGCLVVGLLALLPIISGIGHLLS